MKTAFAAAALALLPALASAAGCGHETTAQMSCAEGQTWDAETRTCVPTTS